jgi:hypothetical protein
LGRQFSKKSFKRSYPTNPAVDGSSIDALWGVHSILTSREGLDGRREQSFHINSPRRTLSEKNQSDIDSGNTKEMHVIGVEIYVSQILNSDISALP